MEGGGGGGIFWTYVSKFSCGINLKTIRGSIYLVLEYEYRAEVQQSLFTIAVVWFILFLLEGI